MNWEITRAIEMFDELNNFEISDSIHNTIGNYEVHLVYDNDNEICGEYFIDTDGFNKLFYKYRPTRGYPVPKNTKYDSDIGDLAIEIETKEPILHMIQTWLDRDKIPEKIRFLANKEQYNQENIQVPSYILNKFFDVSQNTNGTSGMLKKYWYYPSIISHAITPFNACFIMKSKTKYMAYFYSDYPIQTFLRIDLKKSFSIIKKLQDNRLAFKEIPIENQMEILADQI
jgi:hypothetical protein